MIKHRFFLRFHMALILIATGLSGLAVSKLLLLVDLDNIVIRYPLAVLLSYGMFFLFIKLWLVYLRSTALERIGKLVDTAGDVIPDVPDVIGNAAARAGEVFRGAGGGSGGGGASGLFSASTAEAAFQCVLAGSLLKSARRMDAPDWIGGVFRATWIPLAVVLGITWIGAAVIHAYYPNLVKISDILSSGR